MQNSRKIDDIVKVYPNHMKLTIYHNGYYLKLDAGKTKKDDKKKKPTKEENTQRSLRRSRSQFKDIVICNKFEWFMTFTFDNTLHDRYNFNHCSFVMTSWLNRQRSRHSPNLKYLIVPELHEDGAIHFHALVSNYHGKLNPVLNRKTGQQIKSKSGALVYDIPGYRGGRIRQALKLDDNYGSIAGYMQKYMTKDMPLVFGRRRYWTSQNLIRPEKHINGIDKFKLNKIIQNHKPEYITDSYEVQLHAINPHTDIKHTGQQISFNYTT